jgi:hypothetical protein
MPCCEYVQNLELQSNVTRLIDGLFDHIVPSVLIKPEMHTEPHSYGSMRSEVNGSAIHYVVSLYIPSQERPDRVYIMTGTMVFLGTLSEKSLRNSSLAMFSEKSLRNSSLGKPSSESAHYRSGTLFSVLRRPFFRSALPRPDRHSLRPQPFP